MVWNCSKDSSTTFERLTIPWKTKLLSKFVPGNLESWKAKTNSRDCEIDWFHYGYNGIRAYSCSLLFLGRQRENG